MSVFDILEWEKEHGKILKGSVVFVRSDWSKRWNEPNIANLKDFPGVSLEAVKFLHLKRKILFQGHEPLDTDSTKELLCIINNYSKIFIKYLLLAEKWVLTKGYC